jgi:TldD protein
MRIHSDSFEMLVDRAIKLTNGFQGEFMDVRLEQRHVLDLVHAGRRIESYGPAFDEGGFVRVLSGGNWGTASFTGLQRLQDSLERAKARAADMTGGSGVDLAPGSGLVKTVSRPSVEPLCDVPMKEKAFLCRRYCDLMAASIPDVSARVHYREIERERVIISSLGTRVREHESICGMSMEMTGGQHSTSVSRAFSHRGGLEFVRHRERLIEEMAEELSERDTDRTIAPGEYRVLVDPELAGILTHEAFGHLSEADFQRDSPALEDLLRMGRKVGPPNVNVIDDATMEDLPGSYAFDDEGEPGQSTVLVSGGKLAGRLHSLQTAGAEGSRSTGNGRAVDFRRPPGVRMSCTYLQPGDLDMDSILALMDDGLYLRGATGGTTDMERFSFTSEAAYLVKDGRIGEPVRPVTISGSVFDVLGSVRSLGDRLEMFSGIGGCSRGEDHYLPVSFGGPHVLLEGVYAG